MTSNTFLGSKIITVYCYKVATITYYSYFQTMAY